MLLEKNNTKLSKGTKIVFGINDFLVGGVQRQLIRQLKLYDREKFDISIITLFQFNNKEEMYDLIPKDIKVFKLNFKNFRDIKSWIILLKLLRSIRPKVIISSLFFSNTAFRILRLFCEYNIIAREHNTYFNKTFFEKFVDKILSFMTDRIVCVSNTVSEFTEKQEHINKNKFKVIYNGIDMKEIVDLKNKYLLSKNSFKLPREGKMILNVARLTSQKNHELLINAFSEFARVNNNYYLVILGEGSLFEKLSKLITELRCGNSVFLLGNRNDVELFYCNAEFFISASKMEGLSNAYLEALAFGLPVVSTKTAGTDELIIDGVNGYYINDNSKDAILDSLNKMVNTDTMDEMRRSAITTAERFDLSKIVNEYKSLIEEIIKK